MEISGNRGRNGLLNSNERNMKMKKLMVMAAVLCGCVCGFSGTVTVKGEGRVTRHPDGMSLVFSLESLDKDMAKSRSRMAEMLSKVKAAMSAAGVAEGEETESGFRMEPSYHYEDGEGNEIGYSDSGRRVFDGFKHSVSCQFKAPLDMVRLERVYLAVVQTKCAKELSVRFYLIDPARAKSEARRLAVLNAKVVADELCKAANAQLGAVAEVNYDVDEYGSTICACEAILPNQRKANEDDAPLFPSIKVEDITVRDQVVIKWDVTSVK